MHVHPAIAALRSNRASQRRASEALAQASASWFAREQTAAIARDLAVYGRGAALDECGALIALLGDHQGALDWVRALVNTMLGPLRRQPLGEVPFRCRSGDNIATVRLMTCGHATLSLCAYTAPMSAHAPTTAIFADRESTELLLVGNASGAVHHLQEDRWGQARIESTDEAWTAGETITLGPATARHMVAKDTSVLTLQLSRTPGHPKSSRKYHLDSGECLQSASGDKHASRLQLALAVLGALEHRPALCEMERLARDDGCDPDLRWEAVRQALALDPAPGLAILSCLCGRAEDALTVPATRLKQQLLRAHPQLQRALTEVA